MDEKPPSGGALAAMDAGWAAYEMTAYIMRFTVDTMWCFCRKESEEFELIFLPDAPGLVLFFPQAQN